MIGEIFVAALVGWIISECTDVSPWLAIRLVRWAARHMYISNAQRAEQRQEEWEAIIESIPSKTLKLFFGLGLGCWGLYSIMIRRMPLAVAFVRRRIRQALRSALEELKDEAGLIPLVLSSLVPPPWSTIAIVCLIALMIIVVVLCQVFIHLRAKKSTG